MKKFISQPNFFRLFSYLVVIITLGFLINNILINFLNINNKNLNQIIYGLSVILPFIIILYFNKRTLIQDSNLLTSISLYIAKAAFWIVLIIGITDFIISFLVSEKFIEILFGKEFQLFLSSPRSRILFIHMPLVILAFYFAYYFKTLGFIWLSTLVVIAEILIVISRFVYSYEQTFMGDLVRYWYGALFLFQALILLYRRVMYELIFFTINLNKKTKQLQISLDLYFLEYLFAD